MDYSLQGQGRSLLSTGTASEGLSAPARSPHHIGYGFWVVAYSLQNGFEEILSVLRDFSPLPSASPASLCEANR